MQKKELYVRENEREEDWFYLIYDENSIPFKVTHEWSYTSLKDFGTKSGEKEYSIEDFLNKKPNGGREQYAIEALKILLNG